MSSQYLDRFAGAVLAPFGKMPCDTATSTPINLTGYQTVGAVNLNADGMRCLVMNQVDKTKNGVYTVLSGAWIRASDFDGPTGTVQGQLILVTGGGQAGVWELISPNPVQIDRSGGQTTSPSQILFTRWSANSGGYEIDVSTFGAKPDARMVIDVVTTSGSPIVTSATANFVNLLVGLGGDIGKTLKGFGFNGAGALILGTILSVQSSTQATISSNAVASCTAGNGLAYWGSNSGAALNAAYLYASTLVSQVNAATPNAPAGAGMIRVVHPVIAGIGDGYLTTQTLTTYRNVLIDAQAIMYNAIGLGLNDRAWFMTCDGGIQIERLIVECGGGCSVHNGTANVHNSSFIRQLQLWNVGTNFNAGLSPQGQFGLDLVGFDYNVSGYWIKGGLSGLNLETVSDFRMVLPEIIGSGNGISMGACENVKFFGATVDSCGSCGLSIDGSHGVSGDLMAVNVTNSGLTNNVQVGLFDNVNVNCNIDLRFNMQRSGGVGAYISYCADSKFVLIGSNRPNDSLGGVDMTYMASYGSGNAGIIEVDALRDNTTAGHTIANLTGSQYGIFWDKYMNGSTATVHLINTFTNP